MGAEAFLTLQIVDFAEGVDDRVAALLTAGTGITLTYNDGAGTLTIANTGLGGSTGSTDNRILRADGTGGSTVQNSAVTIDDSGNISGVARLDSTRAGSMGSTNPQNQIIIYGGFAGYGIGFDANGELTTVVNSTRRSTLGTHMNLGSSGQLRFNSAVDLSGSWDTLVVRNATGPTVETRAAGGLRVRNADGSAAGALDCGAITSSGTSTLGSTNFTGQVRLQGANNTRLAQGGNDGDLQIFRNDASTPGQLLIGAITASALVTVGTYTFGTLPAAASNAGALAQITDSSVTTNGTIAAGGGSDRAIVFSDGTDWVVAVA